MNQVFDDSGKVIPVTYIEIEPNFITQVKTKEKDGYEAVQFGSGKRRKRLIKKPQKDRGFRWLREFRVKPNYKLQITDYKPGDKIDISVFEAGDKVTVIGISKGKGFQGVVKRHGFAGGPKSHGQKDRHRAPGSIGSSFPEHVMKGMKMAGRMGGDRITTKNLKVVLVDKENQLIGISGAVPGRKGSLVYLKSQK